MVQHDEIRKQAAGRLAPDEATEELRRRVPGSRGVGTLPCREESCSAPWLHSFGTRSYAFNIHSVEFYIVRGIWVQDRRKQTCWRDSLLLGILL